MMFGLPSQVLHLLEDYFSKHIQIEKVIVFGSRAMGKETPGSDIDLAIITKNKNDISGSVQADLEELPTPYMFDVVDYKWITHEALRAHIDRVGKVLFEKELS